MTIKGLRLFACAAAYAAAGVLTAASAQDMNAKDMELTEDGYYAKPGANVLVFSNYYDSLFSDSKISGVEIVQHGIRTATNGDVRLSATPGQWDPIGLFVEREVNKEDGVITATLNYDEYDFSYTIRSETQGDQVVVSVNLPKALPKELEGKAGFNLEFIPSQYWDKPYLADGKPGLFPPYASSAMEMPYEDEAWGTRAEAKAIATGKTFVLAPGDDSHQVTLSAGNTDISLYDGRNQAQNGWYVFRSLLPSGKKGKVLEWTIDVASDPDFVREPVVSFSQVGYTPERSKIAVVELDENDTAPATAKILKMGADGAVSTVLEPAVEPWGDYLRYDYATIDFSSITEPGLYAIEYDGERTVTFPIADDVYDTTWHATLDVFFPAQMDHMFVNEGYRVWHGASHLDDALQAPVDHVHHDLYAQGPTTDTAFEPLEHIPGLNIGGWYDAGDYDIRTQSQYGTIRTLVASWDRFGITRDQTQVQQDIAHVEMHIPDGKADLLQQIEHGTLQLVAQFDAVGHAIHGIVEPDLGQYTHLGDGVTKTDNLVYDASLGEHETAGEVGSGRSGKLDDRWAFTSKSSALNYGSLAGLAAAARALEGYNDELAEKALSIAVDTFAEEEAKEPDLYRHGNTTGGPLEVERFRAAAELLLTTGEDTYAEAADRYWDEAKEQFFPFIGTSALAIVPMMPEAYADEVRAASEAWLVQREEMASDNPFGVLITRGGWAGSGTVVGGAILQYDIHRTFPGLVDTAEIYDAVDFIFGRHPAHNLSLVSGVGAQSKKVSYGTNRADFSYIAGGTVPGILVLKPDLPENREDWPFFWGQNEYVIPNGASHIYLMNAVMDLSDD